jgi:hypothetical protein
VGYQQGFEREFRKLKDRKLRKDLWTLGLAVVEIASVAADPALRARQAELLALRAAIEATSDMTMLLVANDLKKEDLTGAEIPWDRPYVLKQDLLARIDFLLNEGLGPKIAKRKLKKDRQHKVVGLLFDVFNAHIGYRPDPNIKEKERKAADADHFRQVLLLIRVFCYQYSVRHPDEDRSRSPRSSMP